MTDEDIRELIEGLKDFQMDWQDDPPRPESHAARYVAVTKDHYLKAAAALEFLLSERERLRAALAAATKQRTRVANSVAHMVIEWVEGGISGGTDWRNGLGTIIEKRLARYVNAALGGTDVTE